MLYMDRKEIADIVDVQFAGDVVTTGRLILGRIIVRLLRPSTIFIYLG